MLEQLIVSVLRIWFRYKRDQILVKYKDKPFKCLAQRIALLDNRLLKYSPSIGTTITFQVGVHNAVDLINLIDEVSASIYEGDYISTYASGIHFNRRLLTMDEFLTDSKGHVAVFETFIAAFSYSLKGLDINVDNTKADDTMKRYYQRKTQEIVKDLTVVVEALEKLAYKT